MQQAFDLGFHRHHLDTADSGNVIDLVVLKQQADKVPFRRGELGYIVDKKEQALFRAPQPGILPQDRLFIIGCPS